MSQRQSKGQKSTSSAKAASAAASASASASSSTNSAPNLQFVPSLFTPLGQTLLSLSKDEHTNSQEASSISSSELSSNPRLIKSVLTKQIDEWLQLQWRELQNIQPGRMLFLDLASPNTTTTTTTTTTSTSSSSLALPGFHSPRFSLWIVDVSVKSDSCAVLIIPQGRESEWTFRNHESCMQLAKQYNFARLIFVALNRGQTFQITVDKRINDPLAQLKKAMEQVKEELTPFVKQLSQTSFQAPLPILSVGEDVGLRVSVASLHTQQTGPIEVEDVLVEGKYVHRRLVFLNTGLVQSEIRLQKSAEKFLKEAQSKSSTSSTSSSSSLASLPAASPVNVAYGYLACDYQAGLLALLSLFTPLTSIETVSVLGMGGGSLAMFILLSLPTLKHLHVVDIDKLVKDLALAYFGTCPENDRFHIHIEDGLNYIEQLHEQKSTQDVVVIDINNQDLSEGLSFPPTAFLEESFLKKVKTILSKPTAQRSTSGLLLINLGCRATELRSQLLARIAQQFDHVLYVRPDEEHVNVVLAAFDGPLAQGNELWDQLKNNILTPSFVKQLWKDVAQSHDHKSASQQLLSTWDKDLVLSELLSELQQVSVKQPLSASSTNPTESIEFIPCFSTSLQNQIKSGAFTSEDNDNDENDDDQSKYAGMTAEEKKRAKAKAKKLRQKQKQQAEKAAGATTEENKQ